MPDLTPQNPAPETCADWIPERFRDENSLDLLSLLDEPLPEETEVDGYFPHLRFPSLSELAIYGTAGIATFAATGAFAVAKVEKVLGTHYGSKMEHISVNGKKGSLGRFLEQQAHNFGKRVVRFEEK